jgi:hypothetical protein
MTDVFREIEQGYEAKYKLDEEQRFKTRCRRNRLFGLWAADLLGFVGAEADDYARSLVRLEMDKPDHTDVADKVLDDLGALGVQIDEREVRARLDQFAADAAEQIGAAYPMPLGNDHVQVGG